MSKRKAIKRFTFTILCLIIGIILCVVSFPIPFTNHNFAGFANAIKLGLDLKGGVVAVYNTEQLEEGDLEKQIDATMSRLEDLIADKGYSEATITKQGTSQIRIEVPDVDDTQELLNIIETPELLEIKSESGVEAEAEITGANVVNAVAEYNPNTNEYGVTVTFDEEGKEIFEELTTNAYNATEEDKMIYIYLGTELISAPVVQSIISTGETFISGEMSQNEAENLAQQILSGTYSIKLSLDSSEVVSPTLGEGAIESSLLAGLIGILIIFILMFVIYRELGLIANITIMIYSVIMIFLLQAIPLVQLTLPGIAGIVLSIGMAVDGSVIIFERIKEEYALGKKIPFAVNTGFKRSINAILDGNITTIIAAFVLLLLGTGSVKGFAIVLLIGILVSLFTGLVVQKGLLNMYLALNSHVKEEKFAKRLNLTREETTSELN
ncbi:MAG: protein translocase subunit SecD [Clostridia bacterium]|nr:protein translocase subunit SecD [Clostridia bacterium]